MPDLREDGLYPGVCPLDCPDQCSLLLHKAGGKIVKIEGDPEHPVTKGSICHKVRRFPERLNSEERLKYPMKRTGPKPGKEFARISWDEALSMIGTRWKKLISQYGPESILPYSFYGNMGILSAEGLDRRFFHYLGASRLDRAICNSAGSEGYRYTMGGSFGTDPEDTKEAKLIIFWGINAVSTNMHQTSLAQAARKNGAMIVTIDVHKNQTGRLADWFIPILPGTDSALALGMMHVLFKENLADRSFLAEHTVGYKELEEHAKSYTPEKVSSITGVPAGDIIKLAKLYGTTSPSFIRIGNGLQHHDNGGMNIRTISCLPAVSGQWQVKGGGAIKGNSGYLSFNSQALTRPDLLQKKDTRVINMNQLGAALTQLKEPVRSLFVYNSNPAIVAPESTKVRKGLEREDLFTVVHDLFLTETAQYADLILPASSSFENLDFYTSYWHHYIHLQQPALAKYGEAKSNPDVFRLLAKEMNFPEHLFGASDEQLINEALEGHGNDCLKKVTFEELKEKGFIKADRKGFLPEKLPTPSGKIELYSSTMEKKGFYPLPVHTPLLKESDLPFLFVPGPNHQFLNSTFAESNVHRKLEKEPKLHMHKQDAEKLGIADGDSVKVWNSRGECILTAVIGENVLQGVLVSQGLWSDQTPNALVNALTPDRLADMGGGAVFFSGRVQAEKHTE
ncbi:molybdopterin oxidoreductase family protein [Metabacillus sp. GX 13764]|uniref:molybdopterin oxidoreductase family protein n=1 Tax=Metabacillus kandeliae TaxID=2900151 RepID=UPI001E58F273|nr:molybdopterin oxidoreductase family protein [Metabacillus kandeliae]MCD7035549.1 molybdopterin oxidoreductase family protein [Metabacillus kandeliae]